MLSIRLASTADGPQVLVLTWLLLTVRVVLSISQSIHAATSEVSSSSIVGATPGAYVTFTIESDGQLGYAVAIEIGQ